jgi:hypothetical protein
VEYAFAGAFGVLGGILLARTFMAPSASHPRSLATMSPDQVAQAVIDDCQRFKYLTHAQQLAELASYRGHIPASFGATPEEQLVHVLSACDTAVHAGKTTLTSRVYQAQYSNPEDWASTAAVGFGIVIITLLLL